MEPLRITLCILEPQEKASEWVAITTDRLKPWSIQDGGETLAHVEHTNRAAQETLPRKVELISLFMHTHMLASHIQKIDPC